MIAQGYGLLLYINLATLNAHDWSSVLNNCGLWLAAWNNDPEATLTNHPYVMHQYSSNGTVPGIAGRVDLDAWFGSVAQFRKYGYQVPAPTSSPYYNNYNVTTTYHHHPPTYRLWAGKQYVTQTDTCTLASISN
jgi:hypothetical protein